MTVKAVYEDGVLKPKEPLPFKEHEEVEILQIRPVLPSSADGHHQLLEGGAPTDRPHHRRADRQ